MLGVQENQPMMTVGEMMRVCHPRQLGSVVLHTPYSASFKGPPLTKNGSRLKLKSTHQPQTQPKQPPPLKLNCDRFKWLQDKAAKQLQQREDQRKAFLAKAEVLPQLNRALQAKSQLGKLRGPGYYETLEAELQTKSSTPQKFSFFHGVADSILDTDASRKLFYPSPGQYNNTKFGEFSRMRKSKSQADRLNSSSLQTKQQANPPNQKNVLGNSPKRLKILSTLQRNKSFYKLNQYTSQKGRSYERKQMTQAQRSKEKGRSFGKQKRAPTTKPQTCSPGPAKHGDIFLSLGTISKRDKLDLVCHISKHSIYN